MKTGYKSKVKSAGKFCSYLAAIGILALNQPLNMAFATSIVNGDATTPAYLTQGLTSLDVTVTDNAIFNLATANTNNATVSSINVENNLLAVPVVVSNIKATAANGFTINPFSTRRLVLLFAITVATLLPASTVQAQGDVRLYLKQEASKVDQKVNDKKKQDAPLPVTVDEVTKYAFLLIVCLFGLLFAIRHNKRKKGSKRS